MPESAALGPRRPRFEVCFYCPQADTLVDPEADPHTGGAEVQILLLARALAQRGRRVALIVRADSGRVPAEVDGISVIVQRPPRARWRPVARAETLLHATRALLRTDAEVYVQRNAGVATAVVRAASKLRGGRFVYSSSTVMDFDYGRVERARWEVKAFEAGVRAADAVVVQTDEQAELCRARFRRAPTLIRSIAEPFAPRTAEPDAFLWVGRAIQRKRPERFCELAARVPEAQFQMVLVPIGPGASESARRTEALAREIPNLELLSPRPRAEIGELIASAVAVVNTADYEGLSNVFLEAWARGVPALALNHDPDGLIASEGLGAFAGGSVERLAELARELWEGRSDQASLAARCRGFVARRHSPPVVVDRWSEALGLSD